MVLMAKHLVLQQGCQLKERSETEGMDEAGEEERC